MNIGKVGSDTLSPAQADRAVNDFIHELAAKLSMLAGKYLIMPAAKRLRVKTH